MDTTMRFFCASLQICRKYLSSCPLGPSSMCYRPGSKSLGLPFEVWHWYVKWDLNEMDMGSASQTPVDFKFGHRSYSGVIGCQSCFAGASAHCRLSQSHTQRHMSPPLSQLQWTRRTRSGKLSTNIRGLLSSHHRVYWQLNQGYIRFQ